MVPVKFITIFNTKTLNYPDYCFNYIVSIHVTVLVQISRCLSSCIHSCSTALEAVILRADSLIRPADVGDRIARSEFHCGT